MKHLIWLVAVVLFVFANSIYSQNQTDSDTNKKQISQTIEKWNQAMLSGDVSVLEDYFPENGVYLYISYQKLQEIDANWMIKSLAEQFESMKYDSYKLLSDPYIYITENGNTAFVYSTMEVEYKVLNTDQGEKFTIIGLEVLIKENEKWVSVLRTTEEQKEKRQPVQLDESVLNEFNGTYKSARTGSIFTIENDGKNLISTIRDEESVYIPQSEYSFYKDRFSQSIIFGRDKRGKVSFFTYIKDNTCTVMNRIE